MIVALLVEDFNQAQRFQVETERVAPASQLLLFIMQFQAADAGMVMVPQRQARPVGPFAPAAVCVHFC